MSPLLAPRLLTLLTLACALGACRHLAPVDRALQEQVKRTPGAFISGTLGELAEPWVLEDRDFVYALAFSPDGARLAFSVLRAPDTKLVVSMLSPLVPEALVLPVNHYQYDVEALAFSPDGAAVVAVSRDGTVRAFAAADGRLLGAYATEEPLVSVAFHPGGRYLFAGSARGLVTALHFPSLRFAAELRPHSEEVRALAVGADGVLYSASWDKTLAATPTTEATSAVTEARLRAEREGSSLLVRATLDGRASASFVLDARSPHVLVHSALARAAGIDAASLTETVNLQTALGSTVGRVSRGHELTLKGLRFPDVAVVICDACLPPGVKAVAGAPILSKVDLSLEDLSGEARLALKPGTAPSPAAGLSFGTPRRATFAGHLNDVTVDRAGQVLGVAMSAQKAQRTVAGRDLEKKGLKPPRSADDAGLRVNASTLEVLDQWSAHEGVVSTAAISPDGRTLVTGGWDNALFAFSAGAPKPVLRRELGWIVRQVRFSADGSLLAAAAWTPPKPSPTQHSDPAALVYEVAYAGAQLKP